MNSIISPLNARWGSRGARLVRLTSVLSSHSTEAKHHCEHPHWAMDSSPATTHPNSFSTNFKLCRMYSYISFNQQKAVLAKKPIQSSTTMTYFAACQKNWRNHLIQFGDLSEQANTTCQQLGVNRLEKKYHTPKKPLYNYSNFIISMLELLMETMPQYE